MPKHLNHIRNTGDVAHKIKSNKIVDMLELKVFSHSLGARILHFGAILTSQPIVKLSASRERSIVMSLKLVDVIVVENSLLL